MAIDPNEVYTIDYEATYSRKRKISLSSMAPEQYLAHPWVELYLVCITGPDGFIWAGDPKEAPWGLTNGKVVVSHNFRWDGACYLHPKGGVPKGIKWRESYCSADMSTALWGVRDLAGAYEVAYGEKISKAYRTSTENKTADEIRNDPVVWTEAVEACKIDSLASRKLFLDFNHEWSDFEKDISRFNREGQMRGMYIDQELVHRNIAICEAELAAAEKRIPWAAAWREQLDTPKGLKTINAKRFIIEQAALVGLELPPNMNKKDPVFIKWKAANVKKYEWLQALEDWAEASRLLDLHKTALDMVDEEGVMKFNLVYMGALSTGRFSGGTRGDEE